VHGIVELLVNGDRRLAGVPTHHTLLEALRYGLGLTGTKQGCDKGDCGACTVLLDGEPVLSCIAPVWEAEGREVTTVEGIAGPEGLHPLQLAFDAYGAAQCGFCTPGVLMSAYALLSHNARPTRPEIREALAGNLCRCTGYTKIFDAVEAALTGDADTTDAAGAAGPTVFGGVGERPGVAGSTPGGSEDHGFDDSGTAGGDGGDPGRRLSPGGQR
jgi:aerobic-type carbon monoxide dehydrogenase small subunit (CoxS/CutS family)